MPSIRRAPRAQVVGLGGLEPPTSPLSGVRSNHLSYRPIVRPRGTRAAPPVHGLVFRPSHPGLALAPRDACVASPAATGPRPPELETHRQAPLGAPLALARCMRIGPAGGGADRVRTDDPLLAKQVLSQLSYSPSGRDSGPEPLPWPARRFLRIAGVLCGRPKADRLCSKGGDPAAPSDTATLLRLHPSH